jgi:hypothetical protein
MINAFAPGIPLYMRFMWQQKDLKALYLDPYSKEGYANEPKTNPHYIFYVLLVNLQ